MRNEIGPAGIADDGISGMPGEGRGTPGVGHAVEPIGRSLGPVRGLHARRHPTYVDGCFGCKVQTQTAALKAHASARGDGISLASGLKEEHKAMARSDPERYAPATRWV